MHKHNALRRHLPSLVALCFFITILHFPSKSHKYPSIATTSTPKQPEKQQQEHRNTPSIDAPHVHTTSQPASDTIEIEPFTPIPFGTHTAEMFEDSVTHLQNIPFCEAQYSTPDVTLVTQLGVERIENLPIMCQQWGPYPMAAAVFIPHNTKKKNIDKFHRISENIRRNCPTLTIRAIKPTTPLPERDFPTNPLRNIAIEMVTTSHFVYVDGDFITSDSLHDHLLEVITNPMLFETLNYAVIVPAYWMAGSCLQSPECSKQYNHGPTTLETLKTCTARGYCEPFLFSINRFSHSTTRNALMFSENPKALLDIPCFLSRATEPFVLVPTCRVPKFIPCFSGYGKNKIQWIQHLHIMGFRFLQMTSGFILHMPHPPSKAILEYDQGRQLAVTKMYQKFTDWIHEMYDDEVEQTVPMCRGELQQGMVPTLEQIEYVEEDIAKMMELVTPSDSPFEIVLVGHECKQLAQSVAVKGITVLEVCLKKCEELSTCNFVMFHHVENKCFHLSACEKQDKHATVFKVFQKR
eukprot:c8958_g2_i1.p1 GENE.c8958_g2_i1~~c8958_g2_i1.p1  ORF type:complete len:522 (-),score=136.74 c8958_g2_i1:66-1631(-)